MSIGPAKAAEFAHDLTALPGVAGSALVSGAICGAIGLVATPVVSLVAGTICGVIGAVSGAQLADWLQNAANNDEFADLTVRASLTSLPPATLKVYDVSALPCGVS